ncbi:uncharacterized protein Dwil_GK19233 [Drosophila willistoni]|uniref:Phosphatidic acid phosphatase type 2/haloperoxidase domain-containing protein n=1 Tax=Drosophila willistoni TaxID=7260 RepID=B4NP55_DROWI|nr:uncharacterized protein Dwil_GK19233 [Drosophila willistoni]
MIAFNAINGQDEGVDRRGAAPRANMERGDWHRSEEEFVDDGMDALNPDIVAASDEEFDEDEEVDSGFTTVDESEAESEMADRLREDVSSSEGDSGFTTDEESVAESVVSDREVDTDEESIWRELDDVIRMMDRGDEMDLESIQSERAEARSPEYAPWRDEEELEPPVRRWEPARPPTPFRMGELIPNAIETEEVVVAEEGEAEGEASSPPFDQAGEEARATNHQWMEWWSEQIRQHEEAERELLRQSSCPVPYGHERYEAVEESDWPEMVSEIEGQIVQQEGPRRLSEILHFIIELDVRMTNSFVSLLMQWASFQSLRIHCKFLEVSCDGIAWLSSWIAFIWLFNSEPLFEMQLNMLVGLLLDIVVIALLKALVRRRRPVSDRDVLTIGPDKYSFPSGHASRSFFVLLFFSKLYALPLMVRVPMTAWAVTIAISRLILRRHYILDVWVGAVLGICEAYFIKLVWIRQETAANVIKYISEDNVPGGVE